MFGIIFFAGIYGVGKSTVAAQVGDILGIPDYSASDLISRYNHEQYGANKFVSNAEDNQKILASAVGNLKKTNENLIITGHMCIFNKDYSVKILPLDFFEEIQISRIIVLTADVEQIIRNLGNRDGCVYKRQDLDSLQKSEIEQALLVAEKNVIPIDFYRMSFSENDAGRIVGLIKGKIE